VDEGEEADWRAGRQGREFVKQQSDESLNRMLKKSRNHLAADQRGLTPIENKQLIRVHLRLSAAHMLFSAAC
jgi:hypothetical protein